MAGPRPKPSFGAAEHGPRIAFAVERTPVMRLARTLDNRQWLAGVYGAIFRANLTIVRRAQQLAVRTLETSVLRPEQHTGTLERAVGAPEAIYADSQRIILGVGDYLDAVAAYWRPVEEGAPGLEGRRVFGFWTRAPRFDRAGHVGLEPPIGGEKSGRPIVLSFDEPPAGAKRFFSWVISNPPQGKFYFRTAWADIQRGNFIEDTYRAELALVTGPNGRPIVLGKLFRGAHGRGLSAEDFRL